MRFARHFPGTGEPADGGGVTRRTFLRSLGASALVLAAEGLARPVQARSPRRRATVAVFGGGVAGLTAAHELAERGFDVTVFERRAWGGKCRSTSVATTAAGHRRDLPSEHGYRVPFGFYQNLPDTMRRIPFGSNANGVFDNLVAAPQVTFGRVDKHDLTVPSASVERTTYAPQQALDTIQAVGLDLQLPPDAVAHFSNRFAVFLSSCDARRRHEWENCSWAEFIAADRYGEDYRKTLGSLPQFTQASKAEQTSAAYMASFLESYVYGLLGRGTNGPTFRVLDGPTNEAWIDPWVTHLQNLGVTLLGQRELTGFAMRRGRIVAASVLSAAGTSRVVADWYVCALPVERARQLWTDDMLDADRQLQRMHQLPTEWMNGLQFYLRDRITIVEGHYILTDSPWALSLIPQPQFWSADFAETYGDGTVQDKLSVAIADFTRPGDFVRKSARECTPSEIASEVWQQIKRHVNKPGRVQLADHLVHSWDLDPGLVSRGGPLLNEDPLVLPASGTRSLRPTPATGIANLVLCGDYLECGAIITTMESANETGRVAANAILERSGSNETPAPVTSPYRPPEWEPFKGIDDARWRAGQPNLFEVDPGSTAVLAAAGIDPRWRS